MNIRSNDGPTVVVEDSKDVQCASQTSRRNFWNTVLPSNPLPTRGPTSPEAIERRVCTKSDMEISTLCRSSASRQYATHKPPDCTALPSEIRKNKKTMRMQRARKTSSCQECGQNFKRAYDLTQHINAVHLKLKQFCCARCKKRFAHKGTLSKHQKTVHLGLRPFSCAHCGQRFSERGNVNKHVQRTAKCREAQMSTSS
eukprot:gb/GEZJ01004963.1/.p1 GENE.gb/GEZJ01004963.1/~~gb/GEZJ01004963.1/.p1  ORF type:complete len:199 (-),score=7.84 gb/GEZJ01004963.1/:373-969(-)